MTKPVRAGASRRHVLMAAGAALAAAPLNGPSAPARTGGRKLTVAMPVGPRVLEPVREVSNVLFRTAYNIFDTLITVGYRDNARLKPGLATAWRRLEPRVLELDLREGERFHNGDLLTAEDVAFSFGSERKRAFRRMLEIFDTDDPAGTVLHDLTMFYGKRKDVPWHPYPIEYMDFRAANMG